MGGRGKPMEATDFEVDIDEGVDLDLSEAAVVVAYPTAGVVGSLAASYLVKELELDPVGSIHSDLYPAASIVRKGRPSPPLRLYAGDMECGPDASCTRVVVLYSEVPPPDSATVHVARAIVEWARSAPYLIVLEGMQVGEGPGDAAEGSEAGLAGAGRTGQGRSGDGPGGRPGGPSAAGAAKAQDPKDAPVVHPVEGVGSTGKGCRLMDDLGIHCLSDGVVTGLAGALLNEGVRQDREVLCLIGTVQEDQSQGQAVANLLDAVDRVVVEIDFDLQPLIEWADQEGPRLKQRAEQAHRPETAPPMYG